MAAVAIGVALGVAAGLPLTAPTAPGSTPSPAASSATELPRLAAFVRAHPPSAPEAVGYGFLLSGVGAMVLRSEDGPEPVALLTDLAGQPKISPGKRHLTYWTYEERGLRHLHVFDTVALTPSRVILATAGAEKLELSWSTDESFVAFVPPELSSTVRIVALASGDALDLPRTSVRWTARGIALARPDGVSYDLLDSESGATRVIDRSDPLLAETPRPSADPGTTLTKVDARYMRPDGSAATYLSFDGSNGGRWFGESVEVATGKRIPIGWNTGGNPIDTIYVGETGGGARVFTHAPPKEPDGAIGAKLALWRLRQGGGPVTREAVRTLRHADVADLFGTWTRIPPDGLVHVVVIQRVSEPGRGAGRFGAPTFCRSAIALVPVDDRFAAAGGGCTTEVWPTRLPAAFSQPDPLDWISPNGPAPLPSATPK